jgi:hypothetical protein
MLFNSLLTFWIDLFWGLSPCLMLILAYIPQLKKDSLVAPSLSLFKTQLHNLFVIFV